MEQRPNILWIITDHQRTDSLGCYGSKWGKSPNFDRLAAEGVRFANCTSQSPMCVPSRTSQLTGRYPHTVGVLENEYWKSLPDEVPLTWLFRDAGYQVVNFGKCDYSDHKERNPFPWYEFGPGPGAHGASLWALANGYDPAEHHVVTIPVASPKFDKLIVGGRYPLPKEQNEPELLAQRCDEFLAREVKLPFLLRISINAPHTPILPAVPYYGRTDPATIDIPFPSETMRDRHVGDGVANRVVPSAGASGQATTWPTGRRGWPLAPKERRGIPRYDAEVIRRYQGYTTLTKEQVKQARANYYDLCLEIDDVIGSILESLSRHGYSDNTIIAFNTDHGTLLGEHGLAQLRTFYEPVVRVPMILAAPGLLPENTVVTDPVELIDFFPTLMALTGIQVPGNVQGRNLVPQIKREVELPDRPVFSEVDYSRDPWEVIREKGSHRVMIRHGKWKLFYFLYDNGYGEDGALYDLDTDPNELNNLYDVSDYREVVADLKNEITEWQRSVQERVKLET